ncbi:hypothetical protein KC967_01155 [Candidatus Saccharibacteria bacterium]|nr:hypothetical protein [Candidatus Saccharibacteria bacterium]
MENTSVIESLEGIMDYVLRLERQIGNLEAMLRIAEARTAQPHACYREGYVDASRQFEQIAGRIGKAWGARVDPGKSASKKPSSELLAKSIDTLGLPTRITNPMHVNNIHTIGDLIKCDEIDLITMRNFGEEALKKVESELSKLGLSLRRND